MKGFFQPNLKLELAKDKGRLNLFNRRLYRGIPFFLTKCNYNSLKKRFSWFFSNQLLRQTFCLQLKAIPIFHKHISISVNVCILLGNSCMCVYNVSTLCSVKLSFKRACGEKYLDWNFLFKLKSLFARIKKLFFYFLLPKIKRTNGSPTCISNGL